MIIKKDKKGKKKRNERKTWIDKLDKVFSLYIRLRDSKEFGFRAARCISCGEVKPFDMFDAGHFVSRTCMPLRWSEDNVSAECSSCNRFKSSHLLGYRKNLIIKLGRRIVERSAVAQSLPNDKKLLLIKKLGEQRVEELESMSKQTKKWDVDDLKAMYMYYAEKVLEFKKQM